MTHNEAIDWALELCRGDYQRGIILGTFALSGADLKGRAGDYAARYSRSRSSILERLKSEGIPHACARNPKTGRLFLVLGTRACHAWRRIGNLPLRAALPLCERLEAEGEPSRALVGSITRAEKAAAAAREGA